MKWKRYKDRAPAPFVIVSLPRSGTNLLGRSLDRHPQIRSQKERLNPDFAEALADGRSTAECLEQIFAGESPDTLAAGFVIHRADAPVLASCADDIWPTLIGITDLKVIHLRRQNLVKQVISRLHARQTGFWQDKGRKPLDHDETLNIDPADLVDMAQSWVHWHGCIRKEFAAHDRLELTYEGLTNSFEECLARVQHFLGVPLRDLAPQTRKIMKKPLREVIGNYTELQDALAGTEWAGQLLDREVESAVPMPERPIQEMA